MKQKLNNTESIVNSAIKRDGVFNWREKTRQQIIECLEKRLEKKAIDIDELISKKFLELSTLEKIKVVVGPLGGSRFQKEATEFHDEKVAPEINKWLNETYKDLCQDIPEKPDSNSINNTHGPDRFAQNWNAILQAGGGTLSVIGAISALPAGISVGVTTTTTLFIFTTSVVSIPIIAVAASSAALATYFGITKFDRAVTTEELTSVYRNQVVSALREKVLGTEYLYMNPSDENNPELPEKEMSLAQILLLEVDHMASLKLKEYQWPHP